MDIPSFVLEFLTSNNLFEEVPCDEHADTQARQTESNEQEVVLLLSSEEMQILDKVLSCGAWEEQA